MLNPVVTTGISMDERLGSIIGSKRLHDDLLVNKNHNNLGDFALPSQLRKRAKQGTDLIDPSVLASMYVQRLQGQGLDRARQEQDKQGLAFFSRQSPSGAPAGMFQPHGALEQLQAIISSQKLVGGVTDSKNSDLILTSSEHDSILNARRTQVLLTSQAGRLLAMRQSQQPKSMPEPFLIGRFGGISQGNVARDVNQIGAPMPGLTMAAFQQQLNAAAPGTIGNHMPASSPGNFPGLWANDNQQVMRPSVDVYMKCDDEILSDQQILLRKQIQYFESSMQEVEAVAHGRKNKVKIGQIGIRCKHCASLLPTRRPKGAVYYPGSLRALYQAAQNMAVGHFAVSCEVISEDVKVQLKSFLEKKSSPGHAGKKYWAECAKAVGIVETENGGLSFSKE
mmetsp:Transcript_5938/g.9357  ORF Transcript_5938/g.9357 Transcript_5938/m.9357 type:complete len:394 (-) Transcript_5938:129-1310(-)